jgi:hypothetical protein
MKLRFFVKPFPIDFKSKKETKILRPSISDMEALGLKGENKRYLAYLPFPISKESLLALEMLHDALKVRSSKDQCYSLVGIDIEPGYYEFDTKTKEITLVDLSL